MYQMQNQNMTFNPNPSYAAYQYNPMQRFQQPEPQIPQMQPQFLGIQGKVVQSESAIMANDVPMDGSVAFFPKQDMTEIYAKSWNADGTIRTIVFKPVSHDTVSNLSHDTEKLKFDLSDECTGAFMQKFDELFGKIEQIENRLDKIPSSQRKTSQVKKESDPE